MDESLPAEVAHSVKAAFAALAAHPKHILLPIYRSAIYDSIRNAAGPKAHQVRVTLGILAVQHVVFNWKIPLFMYSEKDDDYAYWLHLPHHLVEVAGGIVIGAVERSDAIEEARHLQEVTDLTGQSEDSPYYHEWCVFEAALRCLWGALDSRQMLGTDNRLTDTTSDEEIRNNADPAMWACLSYAGGLWTPIHQDKWTYDKSQGRWITDDKGWYFGECGVWDRNTDRAIVGRREFWEWWLSQAVSKSWSQAI